MRLPHGPGENFNNYGHESDSSRDPIHDIYNYERDHGPVKLSAPPSPPCRECGTHWNVFGNHADANGKALWLCVPCEAKELNYRALCLLVGGILLTQPKPAPIVLRSDMERWQEVSRVEVR